jgi:predicted dithiol-disulfide oxidoreductase (DUF899 family)
MLEAAYSTDLEKKIASLEDEINEKKGKLAELRRQLPTMKISDYIFTDVNGASVKLSNMLGDKKELMLVHNMGKRCPYCTLWADEYNGIVHHLESRVPFVVISPDEHNTMREFAEGRGWKFRIYSSKGNTFKKDVGFEDERGMELPGVSVFTMDDKGNIYHTNKASFGPGDNFCSLWHYFDLLPGGAGSWVPKCSY